jgi:hypothetical protein
VTDTPGPSEGQALGNNLGIAYAELDRPDLSRHGVATVDHFVAGGDDESAARVRQRLAYLDGPTLADGPGEQR